MIPESMFLWISCWSSLLNGWKFFFDFIGDFFPFGINIFIPLSKTDLKSSQFHRQFCWGILASHPNLCLGNLLAGHNILCLTEIYRLFLYFTTLNL